MALLILRAVAVALLMTAALAATADAPLQDTIEDEVKAAFLFNFTKFVSWPAAARPGEPFQICVAGSPAFHAAVEATIAGETADGRPLVMIVPSSVDEARTCQILYVGGEEGERGARLLAGVVDRPVLTVGEGERFIRQGGAIAFAREGNRVRFDIRLPAVNRAGLMVSSKLIRVARTIVERAP